MRKRMVPMIYDLILDFPRILFSLKKNANGSFTFFRDIYRKISIREIIQSYSQNIREAGIF